MKVYQHLTSQNNNMGNPRRLWVVYEVNASRRTADVFAVYDEGYRGRPDVTRDMPELPSVEIPPAEYNSWKRQFNAEEYVPASRGRRSNPVGRRRFFDDEE